MAAGLQVHLYDFLVMSNEVVAQDTYRTVIRAPELAASLKPGQFINLKVPGDPSQIVRIPLSFAGCDRVSGTIELVFCVVGDGTRRLAAMAIGQTSSVVGPCGRGWQLPDVAQASRVLLVAGGIGVTPIVSAGRELARRKVPFLAAIGAKTKDQLWGVGELRELGAQVLVTTDDGTAGLHGFVTKAAERLCEKECSLVLACGPQPMMAAVARLARSRHICCEVSLERMMTCGFGACHTCNVAMTDGGYAFCCTDGPVFDSQEVLW